MNPTDKDRAIAMSFTTMRDDEIAQVLADMRQTETVKDVWELVNEWWVEWMDALGPDSLHETPAKKLVAEIERYVQARLTLARDQDEEIRALRAKADAYMVDVSNGSALGLYTVLFHDEPTESDLEWAKNADLTERNKP